MISLKQELNVCKLSKIILKKLTCTQNMYTWLSKVMNTEVFKMQFSVITYWLLRIIYIRSILQKFAHQVFIFRLHM